MSIRKQLTIPIPITIVFYKIKVDGKIEGIIY